MSLSSIYKKEATNTLLPYLESLSIKEINKLLIEFNVAKSTEINKLFGINKFKSKELTRIEKILKILNL